MKNLVSDQTLSVRQMNALKKLKIKSIKENQELVLEDVVDMFPGKTISTLQSALDDLLLTLKK